MMFFKYLNKNKMLLERSLTKNNIAASIALDILVIFSVFVLYFILLIPAMENISEFEEALMLPPEEMGEVIAPLFSSIVLFTIGFLLLSSIALVSTRHLLWRYISNVRSPEKMMKKIARYAKHYLGTILLFLASMALPIIVLVLTLVSVQDVQMQYERLFAVSFLFVLMFFMFLHLYYVYNYTFARSSRVFHSIAAAFNVGLLSINYFIVPYIIFGLVAYLLTFLATPIGLLIPFPLSNIVYFSLFIVLVTVLRLFLSRLIAVLYKKSYSKS